MKTMKKLKDNISIQNIAKTRQLLTKYGRTSIPFIQNKLNVSFDLAKMLHEEYGDSGLRPIVNNFKKKSLPQFYGCNICKTKFDENLFNRIHCPACGPLEEDTQPICEVDEIVEYPELSKCKVFDSSFISFATEIVKPLIEENIKQQREKAKRYRDTPLARFNLTFSGMMRRFFYQRSKEVISKEERKAIGLFYKNCPEGYEVDHIIPISKGGKHMLQNLQYLTIYENRSKGNKIT